MEERDRTGEKGRWRREIERERRGGGERQKEREEDMEERDRKREKGRWSEIGRERRGDGGER